MRESSSRIITLLLIICSIYSINLRAQSWGDYTLYSAMNSTKAYLIGLDNSVHHQWTFPSSKRTGYSTYMLPGGTIVRAVSNQGNILNGGGMTGAVQKVDWNGTVLWDFVHSSSTYCLHHDICPMPNGNVLMISYEVKTSAQALQAGSSQNIKIWSEKIIEVQPTGTNTGTIVWEWHAWDHLCQDNNAAKDNYVTSISQNPGLLNINYRTSTDWMHANGIDYNATLDQITFSSHNLDELYVIDHSTTTAEAASHAGGNSGKGGDFLYRWGNPEAYETSGTAVLNVVHDAHFVPADCPKANYISAFNNNGGTLGKSTIDLIYPPYNGYTYDLTPGPAYSPSNYDWRHIYSGSATSNMGNAQQLPNGNTLICIAQSGYIYEIDSNQNLLWSKSVSGNVAQAFRYSACHVSGSPPATPIITQNGSSLSATSASSYQWYFENNLITGAISQSYLPTQDGNYQVQISDENGCPSALSTTYNVTGVGINEGSEKPFPGISPNPASGIVFLSGLDTEKEKYPLVVIDAFGKTVMNEDAGKSLDLSALKNGVYIVRIHNGKSIILNERIVLIK